MFIQTTITPDKRPVMAVYAPGREFIYKYFEREFDRRLTENPTEATPGLPAIIVTGVGETDSPSITDFRAKIKTDGGALVHLHVPEVIGTGMTGFIMQLARGVARGTMMKIRENDALLSVIHATDVARASSCILAANEAADSEYVISAPPVKINDLLDALGVRIKSKRVATLKPGWAKILYGNRLYGLLTKDNCVDADSFVHDYPEFEFVNPVDYLKTHVYDEESL